MDRASGAHPERDRHRPRVLLRLRASGRAHCGRGNFQRSRREHAYREDRDSSPAPSSDSSESTSSSTTSSSNASKDEVGACQGSTPCETPSGRQMVNQATLPSSTRITSTTMPATSSAERPGPEQRPESHVNVYRSRQKAHQRDQAQSGSHNPHVQYHRGRANTLASTSTKKIRWRRIARRSGASTREMSEAALRATVQTL